jgi:hypothetical protein
VRPHQSLRNIVTVLCLCLLLKSRDEMFVMTGGEEDNDTVLLDEEGLVDGLVEGSQDGIQVTFNLFKYVFYR